MILNEDSKDIAVGIPIFACSDLFGQRATDCVAFVAAPGDLIEQWWKTGFQVTTLDTGVTLYVDLG